jgi:hypothetical protein
MLNDVGTPPDDSPDRLPAGRPGTRVRHTPAGDSMTRPTTSHPAINHSTAGHVVPTIIANEPGRHHSRHMGEPTRIDPMFAMPFEERGSSFNVTMSIVAIALFALLIFMAWWTLGYQ